MNLRSSVTWIFLAQGCEICAQSQWQSLQGGVSWQVRAFDLTMDSMQLIVAGNYVWASSDSLRANDLAKWDGVTWSIDGCGNGNGDTSQFGNAGDFILSVAQRGDTLFTGMGGDAWQYDLNLTFGSLLTNDTWLHCGDPNEYLFFFKEDGRIFSGGRADTLYGQLMPGVNEWKNDSLRRPAGSPFTSEAAIWTSAFWHDQFYFGGIFLTLGCRKIVAYDGDSTWSPLAGGVGGNFLSAIGGYGDSLYVGGFFNPGVDVQSRHIQIWDGTNWLPFFPQVQYISGVKDIQVHDGALYIAGIYRWAGDTTQYGLLRYDGHELCSIGGPMPSGDNGVMEFYQGDLYLALGGLFEALPNEYIGRLPLTGLVPDTCVTITTGISAHATSQGIRVTPNPAKDRIRIEGPSTILDGGMIIVTDAIGCVAFREQLGTTNTIAIAYLSPGLYLLTLIQRNGTTLFSDRFVKE